MGERLVCKGYIFTGTSENWFIVLVLSLFLDIVCSLCGTRSYQISP